MFYAQKEIIFHITRNTKLTKLYITDDEQFDLQANLTSAQIQVYTYFKFSPKYNPTIKYFSDETISKKLNLAVSTVKSTKNKLKTKGYLLVLKFKDERKRNCMRIVVGKEEIHNYNLGLTMEITDIAAFIKLNKLFDFQHPSLTLEERQNRIDTATQYVKDNPTNFK